MSPGNYVVWSALEWSGYAAKKGGAGDAWTTSVSPAIALSNAADVSYVQTESEDWGGGSSKRINEL